MKWETLSINFILEATNSYLLFVCLEVGLNENFSQSNILQNVTKGLFHRLASSQDGNSANFSRSHCLAVVLDTLRSVHDDVLFEKS